MIYKAEEVTDKRGDKYILRSLSAGDAAALITFVDTASAESPFFPWSPGDTALNAGNAEEYILEFEKDGRRLLIGAFRDGDLQGLTEMSNYGTWEKALHRCTIGTGVLGAARGRGIGRKLTVVLFPVAKDAGYEQMEASVAVSNEASYRNLLGVGFQEYGVIPHKMKYPDGTYSDERRMVKWLMP